ncbi:MAG: FAD-binding domain-containing protein [Planctomycetota bacterium]
MSVLPRDFESRAALIAGYREAFADVFEPDEPVADFAGGREQAEQRLESVNPSKYGQTRNYLDGDVTRLGPFLRHGVLTLAETRDAVLEKMRATNSKAEKLVNELAWRDYWRRVLADIGEGVHDNREAWKTGLDDADYALEMPDDIVNATTGNDFIDGSVNELYETGYLHNQQRMKLAAYVVHWRRVHWHAGAEWMLGHLLDGDLASNHLSWQWVASTFGSKPYIFNQENLQQWMGDRFTGDSDHGPSPFAGSYEQLNERLFPQ